MNKSILKRIYSSMIIVIIIIIFTFCGTTLYSKMIRSNFKDEITTSLGEISGQSVVALRKEINGEVRALKNIATLIGSQGKFSLLDDIMDKLSIISDNNSYKRMGIILPDGLTYTTDGKLMDLKDRQFFIDAMKGAATVSDVLSDRSDGEKINTFAAPIYNGDKIEGVLFATRKTSTYQSTLEVKTYDEKGYSYVVKSNGDAVVASSNKTSFQDFYNIFGNLREADKQNYACADFLQTELKKNNSGYVEFKNKVVKYLYYTPIGVNDWYLLTVVPASILNEKMNFVMGCSYAMCAATIMVLVFLMIYIFRIQATNQKRLERIAFVDELTGERSYNKYKQDVLSILQKSTVNNYAIVSVDIDKFRYINDIFGYQEGNNVIKNIYEILKKNMESGEILAHKAADNFVLLVSYTDKHKLSARMENICRDVQRFCEIYDKHYNITISAGVYEVDNIKLDIDAMVDRADIPRNTIKGTHKSTYAFYDEKIRKKQIDVKNIENRMMEALDRREFIVYYQPKYNVSDSKITGAEALVRWSDTEKGIIPPNEFVPIFEANGFITQLDKYVFHEVCKKVREWMDQGINIVPISVNLSRLHLYNPAFIEEYKTILEKYDIPSSYIQLELTESALFDNANILIDIIAKLHNLGFSILMDDFGTGYSSLNMLKDIPVDVLKLDKGFVEDSANNHKGRRIISSIIQLAQSLHMKVTAEGIETQEQYEFLKKVKCDEIQGYYFAKPMPVEEFEKRLME